MKLEDTTFYQQSRDLFQQRMNQTVVRHLQVLQQQLESLLSPEEQAQVRLDQIFKRYREPITVNLVVYQLKKSRQRKTIDVDNQCMARVASGRQCMRSRADGLEFCKSHSNALPYGRIDGPLVDKAIKMGRKRGRKALTEPKPDYSLEDLPLDKYIQANIVTVDQQALLQDELGFLYTYDENVTIVGRATDTGIDWYQ